MYAVFIDVILTLAYFQHTFGGLPQTCSSPPVVHNSTISPNSEGPFSLGAIISYSCDIGFITEGRLNTVECYLDDITGRPTWTKPNIMCIPRTCGDPGNVKNSHRVGSLFIFPHYVEYICNEGYKLIGRNKRYCQPSGSWTGRLPHCEIISCQLPKKIRNGQAVYNSVEYGSVMEYKCDHGYKLEGVSHVECRSNGTWSDVAPACADIKCPLPQKPENGGMTVSSEKLTLNTVVVFTCNRGWNMIGSHTSKCLESGMWTFDPPKCYLPCELPTLSHGLFGIIVRKYKWRQFKFVNQFKKVEPNVLLQEGESVLLRCENKYEPIGEDYKEVSIICSDSVLTPIPFCHPAKCRIAPPSPQNGYLISYESENNTTPVYKCNADYKAVINGTIVCHYGTWKGATPVCKSTLCPALALANLAFHLDKNRMYKSGESLDVKCLKGYELSSNTNQSITCIHGSWKMSNSNPCKPLSCLADPPNSPNLNAYYNSKDHGTIVNYECDKGYRVNSSHATVICQFGQWRGYPPTCKDTHCYISKLRFNERVLNDVSQVNHNAYLDIRCKKGFVPLLSILRCNDGQFSEIRNRSPCIPVGRLSSPDMNTSKGWKYQSNSTVSIHLSTQQTSSMIVKSPTVPAYTEYTLLTSTIKSNTNFTSSSTRNVSYVLDNIEHQSNTTNIFKAETLPHTTESPILKSCFVNIEDKQLLVFYQNNEVDFGTEVLHGFTVKFQCKNIGMYRLNGTKKAVCENGMWKPPSFPFCNPPKTKDTVIQYLTNPGNSSRVTPDGILQIVPGARIILYCSIIADTTYPQWDVLQSENIELMYENPNYSKVKIKKATVADTKNYTCISSYQQRLTVAIEVKEFECPEIPVSLQLSVTYIPNRKQNGIVIFRCPPLWHLEGPSNATCLSLGKWSALPPQCRYYQCPEIFLSENMSVQYNPNRHSGGIATFFCPPLTYVEGPINVSCLSSGQWSASPPSCKTIECKLDALAEILPDFVMFEWHDKSETVPVGTQLNLMCGEDNYVIRGNKTANCSNGKWILGKPYCIQGCRPVKKAYNSTLIISDVKEYYRLGEQVIFSCPKGQTLSKNTQRVMCLNYGWSEKIVPDCITA